jgi:hypothetical protein
MDLEKRVTKLEEAVVGLAASGGLSAPLPEPSRAQALNDEAPAKDGHPPARRQLKKLVAQKGEAPGYYGADRS